MNKMTSLRRAVLTHVTTHPGCSTADIDRACRTARGGHRWMYAAVNRMIARGMLRRGPVRAESRGVGIYVVTQ
jgi:hypothetical protein